VNLFTLDLGDLRWSHIARHSVEERIDHTVGLFLATLTRESAVHEA